MERTPPLTPELVITLGGWSAAHARVLAVHHSSTAGAALVDTNGDLREIEEELFHLDPGGWSPGPSSGPAPVARRLLMNAVEEGPVPWAYGRARRPGPVSVELPSGSRIEATAGGGGRGMVDLVRRGALRAAIEAAVEEHLRIRGALLTPGEARNRCVAESEAFAAALARRSVPGELVWRLRTLPCSDGGVAVLAGHCGVRVGRTVWDWTARQYDPGAPVPHVLPWRTWVSTWDEARVGSPALH